MSVRHHVSDELLLDYASGSLGESWSLAVSTHLALCPESRQRLEALEMTGGALLTDITPQTMFPMTSGRRYASF